MFGEKDVPEQTGKFSLSKIDHDLYHEEQDIANPVIRIKRITLPNKTDKWKVFIDNKIKFVIEGVKLSKKECGFLQTPEGFNFILNQAKTGIKSFNMFRTELRKIVPIKRHKRKSKR